MEKKIQNQDYSKKIRRYFNRYHFLIGCKTEISAKDTPALFSSSVFNITNLQKTKSAFEIHVCKQNRVAYFSVNH